jgi:TnpA family transposase
VFYTHISDQLDPYRTKIITGTPHEAPHMIDGLLYHETDLDIHEHYADTGGYTDQVFSTCHAASLSLRATPARPGRSQALYHRETIIVS